MVTLYKIFVAKYVRFEQKVSHTAACLTISCLSHDFSTYRGNIQCLMDAPLPLNIWTFALHSAWVCESIRLKGYRSWEIWLCSRMFQWCLNLVAYWGLMHKCRDVFSSIMFQPKLSECVNSHSSWLYFVMLSSFLTWIIPYYLDQARPEQAFLSSKCPTLEWASTLWSSKMSNNI